MSNSKNRPGAPTPGRLISPKRHTYDNLYCIIFGDRWQETICLFCTYFYHKEDDIMAKAKYTKQKNGYFQTRVWDGGYNDDGTKHYIMLRSKKSSKDLENKVN